MLADVLLIAGGCVHVCACVCMRVHVSVHIFAALYRRPLPLMSRSYSHPVFDGRSVRHLPAGWDLNSCAYVCVSKVCDMLGRADMSA